MVMPIKNIGYKGEKDAVAMLAMKIKNKGCQSEGRLVETVAARFFVWCALCFLGDMPAYKLCLSCGLICCYLMIFMAGEFCDRYLYYDSSRENILRERTSLLETLRYHAFSVEEYFSYVKRGIWKLSLMAAALSIFAAFFRGYRFHDSKIFLMIIIMGIIEAVIPYIVWAVKRHFQKEKMFLKNKRLLGQIVNGILILVRFFTRMVCWIGIVIASAFLTMAIWSVVMDFFIGIDVHTSEPIRLNYGYATSAILFIILIIGTILNYVYGYMIHGIGRKKKVIIAGLFFAAISIAFFIETKTYTMFYEDYVVVSAINGRRELDYKDVDNFTIYEEHDAIQMALTFKNGENVKMSGFGVSEETDGFYDKYYGDVNWYLAIIKNLQKQNVKGELRDIKAIDEYMKELAPEMQSAWEEIKDSEGYVRVKFIDRKTQSAWEEIKDRVGGK